MRASITAENVILASPRYEQAHDWRSPSVQAQEHTGDSIQLIRKAEHESKQDALPPQDDSQVVQESDQAPDAHDGALTEE